jgi:hypothetical protein
MYAVFVEVNADESQTASAREGLAENVVPMARAAGAKAGYWLAPRGDRGVGIIVFESEEQARKMAAETRPGDNAGVPGVTVKTIEVSEVLAAL